MFFRYSIVKPVCHKINKKYKQDDDKSDSSNDKEIMSRYC